MPVLQKRWDSTCRVLFGEEVGELASFCEWLLKYTLPLTHRRSSVSGKEVTYAIHQYEEGSKWVDYSEIEFGKKAKQLSVNDIKDIDSLFSSVQAEYAGNTILGNSKFTERSSNLTDCFYMLETGRLTESKYCAYSTFGRTNEDCFGCQAIGESKFLVKCHETYKDTRSFELWHSRSCSDCYYSQNLDDCMDVLFCFNAKNLRHAVGNIQLEQGKYSELKKKLQAEMADGLKKKKELPTLVELFGNCPAPSGIKLPILPREKEGEKKGAIEAAFANTCKILLGKQLPGSIDDYSEWLKRRITRSEGISSCLSGKKFTRWDYSYYELPKERLVTMEEARWLGENMRISLGAEDGISLSNAAQKACGIAFFCPEYRDGMNLNIIECPNCGDSANCYRASPVVYSKNSAYSFWPRSSDHAFGSTALLSSEFCIKCYDSVKLSRCFEVDFSRECSDCYFCHNIENCSNCLLCFNAKNLRYAIGNVEVGREKYLEAKRALLEWMNKKLEKSKALPLDIYNFGSKERKR